MATTTINAFLQRAHLEAERYGSDPWVFVRELLQNARDAGARRVWFQTSVAEGIQRISCLDDGAGMTFEHAERYLFSLYASSKRGRSRAAGRFGIGFWSVLRFEPEQIVVRSQPQRGTGWQIRFDGDLQVARREQKAMRRGTEVVLERRVSGDDLGQLLVSSILRDAPWLRCRHRAERPLEVRVNGRLVRAEPTLPPPSMSFRRRGLRGVVGLGPEPGAEIFAHGFRVRNAATLDELLVGSESQPSALAGRPDGLSPRIIIDSRKLEVLMARGDAREDRALRRLVTVGHRELGRLVRLELDRHTGLSAPLRLFERWRDLWSASRIPKIILAIVVAVVLAAIAWWASWLPSRPGPGQVSPATRASSISPATVSYRDLWGRYRGPDVDGLGGAVSNVDLSYEPNDDRHLFAALRVTGLAADGRPDAEDQRIIGPYRGAACDDDCLDVEIGIDSPAGLLRLPIATGHVLDPTSVRLDGLAIPLFSLASGQPAVRLNTPRVGRLSYRSGPGRSEARSRSGSWPDLPVDVTDFVRNLGGLPVAESAIEVARFVSHRVAYDASAETALKYRQARERSIGFFDRALTIGAGDCDVQNSLVVAMLDDLEIPSRLAVGWIGVDGRAKRGLHAWAEFRGADGDWQAVDASSPWVSGNLESGTARWVPIESNQSTERGRRAWVLPVLVSGALVLTMIALVVVGRPWRRSFQAGSVDDIVGLLRGAAIRPRSFDQIHALFVRRVLRLVSGKKISLARARELAQKGRLACGSGRSEMARRAVRGGGAVLDLDQAESSAVAEVLAAVNLDRWQDLLDCAESDAVTARVEQQLAAIGETHAIVAADNPGLGSTVLDGTAIGLGKCWTIVDKRGDLWQSVARLADRHPTKAALLLADEVVHLAGVPPAVRRRCLSRLAMAAMLEAVGRVS